MAGLDAKVKSIIKETVKSQFIKKEAISYDESLFEAELLMMRNNLNLFLASILHLMALQKDPDNQKQWPPFRRRPKTDLGPSYQHSQGFTF